MSRENRCQDASLLGYTGCGAMNLAIVIFMYQLKCFILMAAFVIFANFFTRKKCTINSELL